MPINENEDWPNLHTCYLAASGSGKGGMLRGNPLIPKPSQGAKIVVWDRAKAYPAYYYNKWNEFVGAYQKAINSGRGFAVGYTGGDAKDIVAEHEKWAQVVWESLNGDYQTYMIDEENGETQKSIAREFSSLLALQSRKYGGVWHGTGQRHAKIPNDYLDNCEYYYVGRQKRRDCRAVAALIGLENPFELIDMANGEFFLEYRGGIERGQYRDPGKPKRRRLASGVIKTI